MNLDINLVKEECCSCGVIFYVSASLQSSWKKTRDNFYCPNGHRQAYTQSTADLLEIQLREKKARIAVLEHELDLANKRKPKKPKKRV